MEIPFRNSSFSLSGSEDELLKEVLKSSLFQNWLNSLDESIHLQSVKLQTYSRLPDGTFNYIKADTVSSRMDQTFPRVIVLDGYSISILPILKEKESGDEFVILQHKFILATGTFQYAFPFEITSNVLPDQKYASDFFDKSCGIKVSPELCIDLIKSTVPNQNYSYIHPYCGPTDQKNAIFLIKLEMTKNVISEFNGKSINNINIKIVPLKQCRELVNDMISLSLLAYYRQFCKK